MPKVKSWAKRRDGKVETSKLRIMSREQLRWQRGASTPKHIIIFLSRDQEESWQPTPVFLHGKFHGQRSLVGSSLWDRKVSDTTEHMLIILSIVHYIPGASSYNWKFVPFDCFHPTTSPLILAFGKHKSDLSLWFFGLLFKYNWPMVVCWGFPGGASGKEPACQCRRPKRRGFNPWVGKIPWRRQWHPTPVSLPGKFHGQWRLVGHSPKGHKKSDATEAT